MELVFMFKPVVGLDISSHAVKMVRLRKKGNGYRVAAVAQSSIDGSSNGQSGQKAIAAAIDDCFRSSRGRLSRNSRFVMGISGPMVKVSSFSFEGMTLDEVEQAVMSEATQVCPFDIRHSVVDYQLVTGDTLSGNASKKKKKAIIPNAKGVLAIAANEVVYAMQALALEASLKCVLMDSDGLAILNCLKETVKGDEKFPAAVINIGRSITTITILGDDGLPFVRDLAYSGNGIIDKMAKAAGISVDQVEDKLSAGEVPAGIEQACKRLVGDINETLSYYSIKNGSGPLKHVYVCGGFSLLSPFDRILTESVNCDVSVWNPLADLNFDDYGSCELIGRCGPAFTVAAGLAMRQI
jgi:type IV pilus assembly protein PilM